MSRPVGVTLSFHLNFITDILPHMKRSSWESLLRTLTLSEVGGVTSNVTLSGTSVTSIGTSKSRCTSVSSDMNTQNTKATATKVRYVSTSLPLEECRAELTCEMTLRIVSFIAGNDVYVGDGRKSGLS